MRAVAVVDHLGCSGIVIVDQELAFNQVYYSKMIVMVLVSNSVWWSRGLGRLFTLRDIGVSYREYDVGVSD